MINNNNNRIELIIDGYKIIIEKDDILKTAPVINHPIQYNPIDIKRKYYKKGDPEYHRKPLAKTTSKTLRSDKAVIQEPLLEFH